MRINNARDKKKVLRENDNVNIISKYMDTCFDV